MRTVVFCTELLKSFLVEHKIATLPDLKEALGTNVDMTVFRKLRELTYRTSYSHRGKYYTLDEIACFNDRGLWFFRAAGFSVFGTLIRTAKALVEKSESILKNRGYLEMHNTAPTNDLNALMERRKLKFRKGNVYTWFWKKIK